MNQRKTLPRAGVVKLNGKRPYRVADDRGRPLKLNSGKPLDRGGYDSAVQANSHATGFNQAVERNARAQAMSSITRRQKAEHRREAKRRQREAAQKAA